MSVTTLSIIKLSKELDDLMTTFLRQIRNSSNDLLLFYNFDPVCLLILLRSKRYQSHV